MQTRIAAFAARLAESSWLAALAVVPVLFNTHTVRIFEEEKAPLLRSLAIVAAVALCIWVLETGRSAWRPLDRPFLRLPLVQPALALTGAYVAATVFSVAPSISFWGAYIRAQGTYTWLAYLVVFFSLLLLLRRRQQLERIVTVVLLASVPGAGYAVLQHFGFDPIPWGGEVQARPHGAAGNPIFLSAHLIMVVPLALARLIEQLGNVRRAAPEAGPRTLSVLLLWCYAALLGLQILAIVFSQSRGPLIGLGVGLVYFFTVFALQRRMRWLALATAATVGAGAVFLVLLNLPESPLSGLRNAPYVGRLGEISDIESGTGKVRVLIWQGAAELLAANPSRWLLGFGPETMFLVYPPHYPPALAHYESRGAIPDRSHNETFDALITTGAVGLLLQLAVFLAMFQHCLQWLGMISSTRQRSAFRTATLCGGIAGGLGLCWVDGSARFVGIGLPVGIAAGCLVYLIGYALARIPQPAVPRRDDLLLMALLAACMAHFVELHFGIAITATRLSFWVYAAMAVAIGMPLIDRQPPYGHGTMGAALAGADSKPLLGGSQVTVSPIVGLLLVLLTFSFYRPSIALAAYAPVFTLAAGVWLIGALLVATDTEASTGGLARLGSYVAMTLGIALLFVAVYVPVADWTPVKPEPALTIAAHAARTASVLYAFLFAITGLNAIILTLREWAGPLPFSRRLWLPVAHVGLALAAAAAIITTNLRNSWADTFAKQGAFYEQHQRWDAAVSVYEAAQRLRPGEDRYATSLGRAYVERGRRRAADKAAGADQDVARGAEILERAFALSPLNLDHPRNLAKAHRVWATLGEVEEALQHRAQAEGYYERALERSPNNAALLAEWATMYLEQRQPQRALEVLNHSLQIDDRYTTTYWLRAQAHQQAGDSAAALSDYETALTIKPRLLPAWSGKASVLARMNRLAEAIEATRQALVVQPNDVISRRNLAVLYRRTGALDLALQEARAALDAAQPHERARLEQLVAELEEAQE